MKLGALQIGPTIGKPFSFTRQTTDGPRELKVLICPLTAQDLDRARVNAELYLDTLDREKVAPEARQSVLADAREIEVLALAVRDPDNPIEAWASADLIRSKLTTYEIALLFKAYHEHQDDVGPLVTTLTADRYEAMLKAIAEAGRADPFVLFDSRTQKDFITSTVAELWSYRMARSSGTSDSTERESNSSSSTSEAPAAEEASPTSSGS